MQNSLKKIDNEFNNLLQKMKSKDDTKKAAYLHRFKESLIKLNGRYVELKSIQKQFDELKREEMGEELHYLQIAFVDKIEAFHQAVYTTISALIMVIKQFKSNQNTKNQIPIKSVKKFLTYISTSQAKYQSVLIDQINILEKSRDFRAKFIDHPQQHLLHDWMTFNFLGKVYLIFFKASGQEIYAINPDIHPMSPRFKPPVNCGKNFYIAPNEDECFDAIQILLEHLLNL